MKLKSKLMLFTAAAALSANMAFAAINPQTLADSYVAEGYSYVEVKVGPTQTKLEAVKGTRKVEVVYDNVSGNVIKSEFDNADDDYVNKTGVEIRTSDDDFEDDDLNDDDEDDSEDDDGDESDDDNDENDDDENDDSGSDDDEDDDSGSDENGGSDDNGGGDDSEGDDD